MTAAVGPYDTLLFKPRACVSCQRFGQSIKGKFLLLFSHFILPDGHAVCERKQEAAVNGDSGHWLAKGIRRTVWQMLL